MRSQIKSAISGLYSCRRRLVLWRCLVQLCPSARLASVRLSSHPDQAATAPLSPDAWGRLSFFFLCPGYVSARSRALAARALCTAFGFTASSAACAGGGTVGAAL